MLYTEIPNEIKQEIYQNALDYATQLEQELLAQVADENGDFTKYSHTRIIELTAQITSIITGAKLAQYMNSHARVQE